MLLPAVPCNVHATDQAWPEQAVGCLEKLRLLLCNSESNIPFSVSFGMEKKMVPLTGEDLHPVDLFCVLTPSLALFELCTMSPSPRLLNFFNSLTLFQVPPHSAF